MLEHTTTFNIIIFMIIIVVVVIVFPGTTVQHLFLYDEGDDDYY